MHSGRDSALFLSETQNYGGALPLPVRPARERIPAGGQILILAGPVVQPNHFESRSQDLEEAYHDAGQFYFGKPEAWINNERIFQNNSEIVVLPNWRVQDIDTKNDWRSAEILMNHIHGNIMTKKREHND